MGRDVETEPSEVTAENGLVFVDGPDGVAFVTTPEAAEETSQRLLDAAAQAIGQQHVEEMRRSPNDRKR
jgi:hypothetical protein